MTLHDVNRLRRHWQYDPPLRMLVRYVGQTLGINLPERPDPAAHMTAEEAQRMFAATGGRIPGVGGFGD